MKKVIIFALMMVFALLVNAEPLEVTLKTGDQGLTLYSQHVECHGLSKEKFLTETAELNGFANTPENWKKIQVGQKLLLATQIKPTIETTAQITEKVEDESDERNGTNNTLTQELTPSDRNVGRLWAERNILQNIIGIPTWATLQWQTTVQSAKTTSPDYEQIIAKLEKEKVDLTSHISELNDKVSNLEITINNNKLLQAEVIEQLEKEKEEFKQKLAASVKNGSYVYTSFTSFIWVAGVTAIVTAGIIILSFFLYKQLSKSRLKKYSMPKIQSAPQAETKPQPSTPKEPYYKFIYPGLRNSKGEKIPYIELPFQGADPTGVPLVKIPVLDKTVRCDRPMMVEAALREVQKLHSEKIDYIIPTVKELKEGRSHVKPHKTHSFRPLSENFRQRAAV